MTEPKVPVKLVNRLISGRGIIQVPANNRERRLILYLNVVRLPIVDFTNSKFNPDKSEYAKITWIQNEYILHDDALNYEHQKFVFDVDFTGYIAKALLCQFSRIKGWLGELATANGVTLTPEISPVYVNPIADMPTVIKIVCRNDTAVEAELWHLEYDINCDEANNPPQQPEPPVPRSKVPKGTPIGDISPPYNMPNDEGDTVPNPGDETAPPDPPYPGDPCEPILITVTLFLFDGTTEERDYVYYAPYYDVYLTRSGSTATGDYSEYINFVLAPQNLEHCNDGTQETVTQVLQNLTAKYNYVELTNIRPQT